MSGRQERFRLRALLRLIYKAVDGPPSARFGLTRRASGVVQEDALPAGAQVCQEPAEFVEQGECQHNSRGSDCPVMNLLNTSASLQTPGLSQL